MRVIQQRNVHRILPIALHTLRFGGIPSPSRFGDVLVFPEPVTTVYEKPQERVVFWEKRDYNIAFCLYEALWMLAGRSDLAPLLRYVKTFGQFSDDGVSLHGAYGRRWRNWNRHRGVGWDQLDVIVKALKENPNDRRCVLAMWNPDLDLASASKDIPCNDMATFQIGPGGKLNMSVFCRSNDILWGAYFANAFHFSFLLEYMAYRIGVPVGHYTQISVNWHGYVNTLESAWPIIEDARQSYHDPYTAGEVAYLPLMGDLDTEINNLLTCADQQHWNNFRTMNPWAEAAFAVLRAHEIYRQGGRNRGAAGKARYFLTNFDPRCDWILSMTHWLETRS